MEVINRDDERSLQYEMSEVGLGQSEAAHSLRQKLEPDGIPSMNLAGFATTYMDSTIEDIMHENMVCPPPQGLDWLLLKEISLRTLPI